MYIAADSVGPVELKRATLGSEDRPRGGGGPGVGSPGPEKEPAGRRGPRPLGARGGHALTYYFSCAHISNSCPFVMSTDIYIYELIKYFQDNFF